MGYLTEKICWFSSISLKSMSGYTLWIRAGRYYHLRVWRLKQLWTCPHLEHLDPPRQDLELSNVTSLKTHKTIFETAQKNHNVDQEAFRKARNNYVESLQLHGKKCKTSVMKAIKGPDQRPTSGGGDTHHSSTASLWAEQVKVSQLDSSSRTKEEEEDTKQPLWK